MAKNTIAYYTKEGRTKTTTITTSAVSDVTETVFTAGSDGSKVLLMQVLKNAVHPITLYINDGTTDHKILTSTVHAAGTDILDITKYPKAPNGMRYINLGPNWTIKATAASGFGVNTVEITTYGEDY